MRRLLDRDREKQRLDRRERLDLRHGDSQIGAIRYIGQNAIGGIFNASGVDVKAMNGPHSYGGQKKTIRNPGSC